MGKPIGRQAKKKARKRPAAAKKKPAVAKKKAPAVAKKKKKPAVAKKKAPALAKKKAPAVVKKKAPAVAKKKAPAVAKKKAPAVAKKPSARRDLYLYNEATGFVVTSAGMRGLGGSPDDAETWERAVATGQVLPVELVQDDSLLLRVVVGAPLLPEEEEGWVGRLVSRLSVPDGRLVVGAGYELMEEVGQDFLETFTRELDVPRGEYRATVLAYAHGVNGDYLLERAGGEEALGSWWRRTRAGEPFPSWLAERCRRDPRLDPGHWDDWSEAGEEEPTALLDFVIHLEPLAEGQAPPPTPPLDHGFVSPAAFEVRRPERCPGDLVARNPLGREDGAAESAVELPPARTVDVGGQLGPYPWEPLQGGPVEHPLRDLVQAYRIAWLAADGPDPELLLTLPPGSSWAPDWPPVRGASVEPGQGRVRIGFAPSGGRWDQLHAVGEVAAHLGSLPDWTVLELRTAPSRFGDEDEERDDPRVGFQRYRGAVKDGVWRIAETYPPLQAGLLAEALAFAREIEGDERLACRDEREVAAVLEQVGRESYLYQDNPVVQEGLSVGLTEPDRALLHFLALPLFRARWGQVWPCTSLWDEEDAETAQAFSAAASALEAKARELQERLAERASQAELLLSGQAGRYHRADLRAQRPFEADFLDRVEQQLAPLGYRYVGDLVCTRFADVIVSGWTRPEGGDAWAAMLTGVLESSFELVSELEGGAWLTTKLGQAEDDPHKGLYRTACPDLDFHRLRRLHERHEARKAELAGSVGAARPTSPDLRALAGAVDRSLVRQLGL